MFTEFVIVVSEWIHLIYFSLRYFIVMDDIRTEEQWKSIKSAFPQNDIASRILITTTIQSVAKACRSADGYVHKMSRLDEECSKQLFSKKACPEKYLCYEQPDSTEILKKCDGHPLALVTIGEFLQRKGWPTGPTCEDVCNQLHYHLENDGIFGAMRRVLIHNYTTLPGHALKACLLYLGTFPSNHPIRTKRLLRRWLAEGFLEPQSSHTTPDPANYFDVLIDRNIIEPINVSNNEKVKTCQTYGMMHEFLLHMAVAQNFVTLFCDNKVEPRYVRRLSLHNTTVPDHDDLDTIDLSLVRSLTIFGKANEAILDFSRYQLMRVLDLEKCDGLKDGHLKNICSLLLLKYLSLGGSVTRLPRDIAKLRDLEVLDLRRTNVNTLPVEVFQLPCLVHLFGKFEVNLECEVPDFVSKGKGTMQTLAGFVTDGKHFFLHHLGNMKKLRKLKIWLEPLAGADGTDWTHLRHAIQQFIKDKNDANTGPRSLSLHFEKCSEDFLNSLEGPCYLSSLKLHGKLSVLPEFIISLRGLKELCLSSAILPKGLLEALGKLRYLTYLKLVADELDKIITKDKAFPRLLRLCFVLQSPTLPTIEEGSMPFLITLQLLCKDSAVSYGLSDFKIEYLKHLKEVILDHRVDTNTRGEWERAAKEHPNRPRVFSTKMTDAAEIKLTEDSTDLEQDTLECTENSVASKGSVQETDIRMLVNQELESSDAKKKQNNCAAQSSSDELNSASSNMGISEFCPSTEFADLPEDVSVDLELAKTKSAKYSVASNGFEEDTDTQMSNNQGLKSTIVLRKHGNCVRQSNSIGKLDSTLKDVTFQEDSPLAMLSETASTPGSEPMDDPVTLEHPKIESMEHTGALEESIMQINTQIHVRQ
jgi:hypothetical protein